MLDVRSANLMELSAALPREIGTTHDRYQYMERQLKNDKTDVDATIKPYALEVIERLSARGETIILQMDQSHINDVNEVLMLSVRLRKRAFPRGSTFPATVFRFITPCSQTLGCLASSAG